MRQAVSDLAHAWRAALRRYWRGFASDAKCRRRRSARGASLVELAVAISILLLLMMGVAEFGAIYKDQMVLNQATREGARVAIVGATSDVVDARVRATAPTLDLSRLTTEVRYSGDDGATFALVPGVSEGRNDVPSTALMRVRSEYRHRLLSRLVLPGRTEVTLRCNMVMQRQ